MNARASHQPLVTVIVLCYNHARFVCDALDSVRAQTYPYLEVVVLDDCSKDDSVSTIKQWLARTGFAARLVRHSQNRGICRSLNEVLATTRGDYVAIIAADDVWMRRKTEAQVALLESLGPQYGVAYSDAYQIDEKGQRLPKMFIESYRKFAHPPEGRFTSLLSSGNFIPAMATLIRRRCYETVGFYDEALPFEDWDMWLRISSQYLFAYTPEVTASYRIVSTSMVRTRVVELHEATARLLLKHFLACPPEARSPAVLDRILQFLPTFRAYRKEAARELAFDVLKHRISVRSLILFLAAHSRMPNRVFNTLEFVSRPTENSVSSQDGF